MRRFLALIAALTAAAALLITATVGHEDGATQSPTGFAATPTVSAQPLGG